MALSPLLKLKAYGKNILVCKEEKEKKEEKEEKVGTMKKSTAEVMIEVIEQDMAKEAHAVVSMKAIPSELRGSSQ